MREEQTLVHLESEDGLPVVFHADDGPALLLRVDHERGAQTILAARLAAFGREQKIARGDGVAAFLGDPDHSARVDCYVLHDARIGARHWEAKAAADILRPDAYAARSR